MSTHQKEYTHGDVTVVWKKDLCIHSAKCVKGLPTVFNLQQRPWVQPGNATAEEVTAQVSKCPSGALTIKSNEPVSDTGSTTVDVAPNGPLLVKGNVEVCFADGRKEQREKVTAFCRCGASSNKPYCDGTHNKIEFQAL